MSMFKTIGIITGGVLLGATATMFISTKGDLMDYLEDKMKEKTGDAIRATGEKVADSISPERGYSHHSDDILFRKISNIEDMMYEIKDMLEAENEKPKHTNKDTELEGVEKDAVKNDIDDSVKEEIIEDIAEEVIENISEKDAE